MYKKSSRNQQKILGDKIYKNKDEWFQQVVDAEENLPISINGLPVLRWL
jgi:hypothetical protein